MRVFAMTKKGEHDENEDRILVNGTIINEGFFSCTDGSITACIADGVGGNNAGAKASQLVVEGIKKSGIDREGLLNINRELLKLSESDSSLFGMASTLSGVVRTKNGGGFAHVGNTRIWIFQSNYMRCFTRDHTTVNRLLQLGMLNAEEAKTYPKRNEITACMGGGDQRFCTALETEAENSSISGSRKIVLTSDGVHEYVSVDELEELLSGRECCEAVLEEIIKRAEANGSLDDKSIVVLEVD